MLVSGGKAEGHLFFFSLFNFLSFFLSLGHMDVMRKAREMGDYLVVGVLGDDIVNRHRGLNYPILNLNERVLSVMGCKVGKYIQRQDRNIQKIEIHIK